MFAALVKHFEGAAAYAEGAAAHAPHAVVRAGACAAIVATAFLLATATAEAQESRTVYAPMTFKAEAGPLRTTACLQLLERTLPATRWWEAEGRATAPADDAFKAVIAAIKQQDRAALLKLTDPAQARDTANFDKQAYAFFAQLKAIQLVEVARAYELDGLVVYMAKLQSDAQAAFVPFAFAHQADDTFRFLPSRSDLVTFTIVNDWFIPSLSAPPVPPPYCAESAVKRATHRVSLAASSWRPSALRLTGVPLEAQASQAGIAAQVKSTIDRMKTALKGSNVDEFAGYMTPIGGDRLKQFFASAQPAEREAYAKAFIDQQPFFVFDESPLVVVYVRTPQGRIEALYFTVADKRLLWTNSAYITVSDKVFKQGPLFSAAESTPPFNRLVIK
jgi:hypothetical protein